VPFHAGERECLLDVHGSPLRDARGRVIGGILTIQNVTEDVEMERRLNSAERLALIGKIAAKVAHELNNPLDGILRFMSMARKKLETDPDLACEYIRRCEKGLQRMGRVIGQLLSFARSGDESLRSITISQVIEETVALFEGRAADEGICRVTEVPNDLPAAPSPELGEVMNNLLKNALEAMSEGGRLEVRARQEESTVKIAVSDTGPGIPDDVQERVFEPFVTSRAKKSGTGLGLTVCKDIMDRMGGHISLSSSEGGTTFELTVPLDD
jgi:signal transduction histidine kinase